MVLNKKYIFLLVGLFAVHLIFAEESSNTENSESDSESGSGDGENSTQSRFFFFTRFVSCNYTAQAGRTCSGCRQTLLCTANNIGIQKTCHGLLPFCNQGRCSFIPGSACNFTG